MNVEKLNWLAKHGDIWAMWQERGCAMLGEVAEDLRKPSMPKVSGTVAVMPLTGVLTQAGDDWFGGTSTEAFGRAFDAAMAHQNIAGIVIKVDSPGGVIYGTQALADKVYAAREGGKPVVAIADSLAASAAFWIGTAASKFVVTPHGDVGSVGVWSAHYDLSEYYEKMGVKATLVSAGKFKVEGHEFGPLDEAAKAEMQSRVDMFYGDFIDAVAKHRGVRRAQVQNGFGQGRVVNAKAAADEGMADGVMTLDEVLRGMIGSVRKTSGSRAEMDAEQEIHAAYMGAMLVEQAIEPGESDEAIARRKEREARVAQLRASERAERVKEMEEV